MVRDTGSKLLDDGKTPEEWSRLFKDRGMTVSPRTLRQKARALQQCHIIGHGAMLISPQQMDCILSDHVPIAKVTPHCTPGTPAKVAMEHLRRMAQKK